MKNLLPNFEVIPEISLKLVGEDIANKTITLKSDNDEYSSTTGSAGGCTIKNIKTGMYSVVIGEEVISEIQIKSGKFNYEISI